MNSSAFFRIHGILAAQHIYHRPARPSDVNGKWILNAINAFEHLILCYFNGCLSFVWANMCEYILLRQCQQSGSNINKVNKNLAFGIFFPLAFNIDCWSNWSNKYYAINDWESLLNQYIIKSMDKIFFSLNLSVRLCLFCVTQKKIE